MNLCIFRQLKMSFKSQTNEYQSFPSIKNLSHVCFIEDLHHKQDEIQGQFLLRVQLIWI